MNKQYSSKVISSNQLGIHEDLETVFDKHLKHAFNKPISEINKLAFVKAHALYQEHPHNFILDSGCGVGESTFHIAEAFPDAFVLGVDQSSHRIETNNNWQLPKNAQLIQANLIDFWRLAEAYHWQLNRHYLLYPNPWPKKKHLQRRWHGHPVFPVLKALGGELEMRTNWQIYAEEFKVCIERLVGKTSQLSNWSPNSTITPFERKYQNSGQTLYQLLINLNTES